jgi:hypothetical protein
MQLPHQLILYSSRTLMLNIDIPMSATAHDPESHFHHPISLRCIVMLSYHLLFGLPSEPSQQAFHQSSVCIYCFSHPSLDFTILTDLCKLRRWPASSGIFKLCLPNVRHADLCARIWAGIFRFKQMTFGMCDVYNMDIHSVL